MDNEQCSAFIVHRTSVGETSLHLQLFTANQGLMPCHFRGAYKKVPHAFLQLFVSLRVIYRLYRGYAYVDALEPEMDPMEFQPMALIAGYYLHELLLYFLKPFHPATAVFQAYQTVIKGLSSARHVQEIEALLRCFECVLLEHSGWMFSLTEDLYGLPLHSEKYYDWVPDTGLVLAEKGYLGAHLLAFNEKSFQDEWVLKTSKHLMRRVIEYVLGGRKIRTRGLLLAQKSLIEKT